METLVTFLHVFFIIGIILSRVVYVLQINVYEVLIPSTGAALALQYSIGHSIELGSHTRGGGVGDDAGG